MPAISIKNNLGKPVKIIDIRSTDDEPGLREYEISLVRLLDKITNGTVVELNQTGTSLYYQPGLLFGGKVEHECSLQRGIGYYLEVLLTVGIFCKCPLHVTLRGVTNNNIDPSVDHYKSSGLSTLRQFVLDDEGLDIKIRNRGMLPLGGGEVVFRCPVRKYLRPVQLRESGMVKRIRGTVYALRVSPAIANRIVESAKGVLLKFIPDVYIHTDQCRGRHSGRSPGFGVHLFAETTTGLCYSAEQVSSVVCEGQMPVSPESLGTQAAHRLLQEIYHGGCTDSAFQALAVMCMTLGQKDVSSCVTGPLSEYTVACLQHIREYFGVTFKLEHLATMDKDDDDDDDEKRIVRGADKVLMTCVGIGYTNLNKKNI
ncbi:Rtc1 [Carabus blaptoides fortunei]